MKKQETPSSDKSTIILQCKMAVPCDVCVDVSRVQFFLLSFHSVTNVNYYYPSVAFMEFTDMPLLQLECNYGSFSAMLLMNATCKKK
jgi:hypothetical protein